MAETLVLIEHDGVAAKKTSLVSITLARQLGRPFSLLIIGAQLTAIAESLRGFGAESVLVFEDASLAEPVADRFAAVVVEIVKSRGFTNVVATSSTFAKDVLPRTAAKLDAAMLSDITAVAADAGNWLFERPISAGSMYARVRLEGAIRVLTARGTAFGQPTPSPSASPVESVTVQIAAIPGGARFVSRERAVSSRPDLADARIIVCGGRPLKDKETFEKLIGGLADTMGAAVGATRAAVDAGMAPNDWQVGQTGKAVAPELYLGIGVSGAIQHMAGIQDSRIIVAINRDPEAPMVQMATYSLVGDLFDIIPRLSAALRNES